MEKRSVLEEIGTRQAIANRTITARLGEYPIETAFDCSLEQVHNNLSERKTAEKDAVVAVQDQL